MGLPTVLAAYGAMSALALGLFALDKRRARRGGRRVPEARLHTVELLGGWPGALLAARWLRHKTRKTSYRVVTLGIVLLHGLGWFAAWRLGWLGG